MRPVAYSVDFWRPGQEVKLALEFFREISKIVDPKLISVIFLSEKKKERKKLSTHFRTLFPSSHGHIYIYIFIYEHE